MWSTWRSMNSLNGGSIYRSRSDERWNPVQRRTHETATAPDAEERPTHRLAEPDGRGVGGVAHARGRRAGTPVVCAAAALPGRRTVRLGPRSSACSHGGLRHLPLSEPWDAAYQPRGTAPEGTG